MGPDDERSGEGALAKAVQHPWFVAGPLALVVAVASTLIAAHLDVWWFGGDPAPPAASTPAATPDSTLDVVAKVNDPAQCPPYAAAPDVDQVDVPGPNEPNTAWATRVSAVPMGHVQISLLFQGSTSKAIVITGLTAVVDEEQDSSSPVSRYALGNDCGDAVEPRTFEVDLDSETPEVVPLPPSDQGQPTPAFPYTVSESDVELFEVDAAVVERSVGFHLEVAYLADGEPGTSVVKDADGSDFTLRGQTQIQHDFFLDRGTGTWLDGGTPQAS